MGHHYVPQYYLKGFSKDNGKVIWLYDKKQSRALPTQVVNVANETGFYTPGMEKYLANTVEDPANDVLRKIRDRVEISIVDKSVLSDYIVCMMKRVPRSKEILKKHAPNVVKMLGEVIESKLRAAEVEHPEKTEFIQKRREEIWKILEKLSKDPPKDVWLSTIPAKETPDVLSALNLMTWIFFTFEEYPAFITSDNPVFYFTNLGMGNPNSELTFPISSHIALWASWRLDLKEGYVRVSLKEVRELNRRTASFTTRFAFHSIHAEWILPLLKKDRLQLNRIM